MGIKTARTSTTRHTNREHFNNIADTYHEEIPNHIRSHLINKWWHQVSCYFFDKCKVIDIGCGDGTNVAFLRAKGFDAIGIDLSEGLIRKGKERCPQLEQCLFEGNALSLQFLDNTFDVVTMIGVLHHICSKREQDQCIHEALRVTKNDGFVIIRESNLTNPLFRFFWNYLFPLTSRIDRFGGENWISAEQIKASPKGAVERTFYFTFIPAFTPRILMPFATWVEKHLEDSGLKKLSAHYTVVLRKRESSRCRDEVF